jgi:hypothetical protein
MDEYRAEEAELETEGLLAQGAIAGVLNATNSIEDFFLLLPDSMHWPLRTLGNLGLLTTGSPKRLSQDQLQAVKDKHAEGLLLLKKRMVLSMLG